jgi:hypothetical protein
MPEEEEPRSVGATQDSGNATINKAIYEMGSNKLVFYQCYQCESVVNLVFRQSPK